MILKTNRLLATLVFLMIMTSIGIFAAEPEKREKELLEKLDSNLSEQEKINVYYNLAVLYIGYKKEHAFFYAKKLNTFDDDLARMYSSRVFGKLLFNEAKYDSAQLMIEEAQDIYESNFKDDSNYGIDLYNSLGQLYAVKNQPDRAIDYYLLAMNLAASEKDNSSLCAICTNISYLYGYVGASDSIKLYYAYRALNYAKNSGDLNAVEQAYSMLGNTLLTADSTKKGLDCQLKGLEISRQLKSKPQECFAALNVACSYLELGAYDKSEYYYKYALEIAKLNKMKRPQAYIYSCLSDVFREIKKYNTAKAYVDSALTIIDALSAREQLDVYFTALYLYAATCDLSNFEETFEIFDKLNSEAHNVEMHAKMADLEARYDSVSKELKIITLKKQRKMTIILSIAFFLVIASLLIALMFRQKSIKNRTLLAEQKLFRLEQEKKLIVTEAMLEGETAERDRLAKDLHDGLGGMLSVVKLNLRDLKNGVAIDGDEVVRFNRALEMLDDSIGELRRVAHHIMPRSLMECGLKASLADFCAEIPNVEFHHFGDNIRIENKLEILIYRSAHELVNNAVKHANASHIYVQLVQEENRTSLTVQDDGDGFDTTKKMNGMGLQNIRSRVETFNGSISIYSSLGSGTEVNIEFTIDTNDNFSNS